MRLKQEKMGATAPSRAQVAAAEMPQLMHSLVVADPTPHGPFAVVTRVPKESCTVWDSQNACPLE